MPQCIPTQHNNKKNLKTEAEWGLMGKDGGGGLTNVQYKTIWNCHNESPHTMTIIPNKFSLKERYALSTHTPFYGKRRLKNPFPLHIDTHIYIPVHQSPPFCIPYLICLHGFKCYFHVGDFQSLPLT
jgi:hypothetical protein